MKKNLFLALGLCAVSMVSAQEQNVPEALDSVYIQTKSKVATKNLGKVVSVIDAETLERRPGASVATLINEVSGIEINGSGSNAGQNLGYFVRGGRNRQVVVLIDGVAVTDPSQIANDYDLRLLPAASVERIEIIKGASSVLYGSGAGTAVISIQTKKAAEDPFAAQFETSLGTNRPADGDKYGLKEIVNAASLGGTSGGFSYKGAIQHQYTDGLSAIAAPEGEDAFEADTYNRYNLNLDLGYRFSDAVKLSRFVAQDHFDAGFDDFSYTDADNKSITDQFRTGGNFRWDFKNGNLVINDSHIWVDREIESSFPTKFESQTSAVDAYANYKFLPGLNALLGVNATFSSFTAFAIPFGGTDFEETVNSDTAKFDIIDPYLNINYVSDFGLDISAGARLNNHSNYGSHVVYNINPSYGFDFGANRIKILGSYSTAYITPSLFQLYDPLYGNEDLQPEENATIEGGVVYSRGNTTRISAVYFNRTEDQYVDFVTVDPEQFIFQYQNIDDSFEASGVEVELFQKIGKRFDFTANYTNTQADERFALRVPEHKVNASLNYRIDDRSTTGLQFMYVSDRDDSFFNPETFMSETVVLDSYNTLDFRIDRKFSPAFKLFLSVTNLLDEDYGELYRYQTRGRNFRLGLRIDI